MPNHKSAIKRMRQSEKRRLRNRHYRTTARTMIKRVRTAIEARDVQAAESALESAIRALTRAASKGIIRGNQASRKISRLTRAVNAIKQASAEG